MSHIEPRPANRKPDQAPPSAADDFRTELTAAGEQYVIPGCEKAPEKGQQMGLWG